MSQPPNKRWKKSEKKVVEKYGGRGNANSGAMWHQKGDGRSRDWCLEVKGTNKDEFKITPVLMKKIEKDASVMGRDPLLIVNFARHKREVCVFPDRIPVPGTFFELRDPAVGPWSNELHIQVGGKGYRVLSGPLAKDRLGLADS